ncbi:hypothetical protein L211DRAFT_850386 [Terfezia boudieri ATCC MYA-4762]|uniref:Uncharacterized protein n=1 Tax=Terfezia boudieri ATCC MYA-4762 TaxID=1051890 RepID=A0A3N4LI87_9PEZI|nr:hypothetical protein L211DRAFT_850386 [Terfezia boudieri ATCC MYA-4762]
MCYNVQLPQSAPGPDQEKWRQRTEGLMNALEVFFVWGTKDVMYEVACERDNKCNHDCANGPLYPGLYHVQAAHDCNRRSKASTLILSAPAPVTATTGGTSKGDLNAGMTGLNYTGLRDLSKDPITTGEKVDAAFLTLLMGGVLGGFAWFMVTDRI